MKNNKMFIYLFVFMFGLLFIGIDGVYAKQKCEYDFVYVDVENNNKEYNLQIKLAINSKGELDDIGCGLKGAGTCFATNAQNSDELKNYLVSNGQLTCKPLNIYTQGKIQGAYDGFYLDSNSCVENMNNPNSNIKNCFESVNYSSATGGAKGSGNPKTQSDQKYYSTTSTNISKLKKQSCEYYFTYVDSKEINYQILIDVQMKSDGTLTSLGCGIEAKDNNNVDTCQASWAENETALQNYLVSNGQLICKPLSFYTNGKINGRADIFYVDSTTSCSLNLDNRNSKITNCFPNVCATKYDNGAQNSTDGKTCKNKFNADESTNLQKQEEDYVVEGELDVPEIDNGEGCITGLSEDSVFYEILDLIRLAVPILLIILGAVDFGTVVISQEQDAMKKAIGKFIKRAIAAVAIFFVPLIVELLLKYIDGMC